MTLGNTEYCRAQCPAIFHTPKIVTCSLDEIIFLSAFVFQFVIQKSKDQDIQNYNFARCHVWVRNLIAEIERGT